MKKLFLVGALVCAGQLYCMENLYEKTLWEEFPEELQRIVVSKALDTSNTLNEAVNAIKKLSILHNVRYDNIKDMAALVDVLTNKFPDNSQAAITKALEKHGLIEFRGEWKTLPDDVKGLILIALLQSGNDLNEAVKNIVKASAIDGKLNKMINYNDFKGFTTILHILADKFKRAPYYIALEFKTPTARLYSRLQGMLDGAAADGNAEGIEKLVQGGADVHGDEGTSLLLVAIKGDANFEKKYKTIKLLLNYGVDPNVTYKELYASEETASTALTNYYEQGKFTEEQYEQIKALFENAIQQRLYQKEKL